MSKILNDFADAAIYLLAHGLQIGFLILGVFMFIGQLIWH